MIQQEIYRINNLSIIDMVKQKWAGLHQRPANLLWLDDSIIHLKNIGPAKAKQLEEANVTTVRILVSKTSIELKEFSTSTGLNMKLLTD